MTPFHRRMLGAALLDREVYEEVEADRGATPQALAVVVLSALGAGIGSFANGGVAGILWCALAWLVGWYVWAWLTYLIGTRLLPTRHTVSDPGELLRTLGFSSAPGVLWVFAALIPQLAGPMFLLCTLWVLATMVVAIRQALDYESTWRALAVCAIGFPVPVLLLLVTLLLSGPWPI